MEHKLDKPTQDFICEHATDDIHQLALQANKYKNVDMQLALQQIGGMQKAKTKIPTFYANKDIIYPIRLSMEQCSSETTARYKSQLCKGDVLVDLSGGFGVDCFFMAGSFQQAYCVEQNEQLSAIQYHNFKLLNRDNIQSVCDDSLHFIENFEEKADWIYMDPARRKSSGGKAVLLSDCEPNIKEILPDLLAKTDNVLVKLSPMIDITATIRDLPCTKEVHIVAVENECKEVLIVIKKTADEEVKIVTINFLKEGIAQKFDFDMGRESSVEINYTIEVKKYIYEPNAAVMKSGAFRSVANFFNLEKLHPSTHLYTSEIFVNGFVGRVFAVKNVWHNSSKTWKEYLKGIDKANVSVRNYPLTTTELKKKLKLIDGGNTFLFACTLNNGNKVIIECEKTK